MASITDAPPLGTNYIAIINTCLQSLMIAQSFLILLLPLLVALFYYSTPYSRRQPIFVLNVIALSLAFIVGVITDAVIINVLLAPQSLWPAQIQLSIILGFIIPFQGMLADAVLLVRLMTVHPLSRIGLVRFALLTSLPIALKIARLINLILYTKQLCNMANGPNAFQTIATAWLAGPYMKIEWISQVVDNSYVSIAFLWTIWGFRTDAISGSLMSAATFRQSSTTQRIRILFNLALSNFIIPTMFSIIQLAMVFRFGDSETNADLMNGITYANAMTSVCGVVFATVWAGKEHWREANIPVYPFPAEQGQQHACKLGARIGNTETQKNDFTSSGASEHVPGVNLCL